MWTGAVRTLIQYFADCSNSILILFSNSILMLCGLQQQHDNNVSTATTAYVYCGLQQQHTKTADSNSSILILQAAAIAY